MKLLLLVAPFLLLANPESMEDTSACDKYLLDLNRSMNAISEHMKENRDISVYNEVSITKLVAEQYLKCIDTIERKSHANRQ